MLDEVQKPVAKEFRTSYDRLEEGAVEENVRPRENLEPSRGKMKKLKSGFSSDAVAEIQNPSREVVYEGKARRSTLETMSIKEGGDNSYEIAREVQPPVEKQFVFRDSGSPQFQEVAMQKMKKASGSRAIGIEGRESSVLPQYDQHRPQQQELKRNSEGGFCICRFSLHLLLLYIQVYR